MWQEFIKYISNLPSIVIQEVEKTSKSRFVLLIHFPHHYINLKQLNISKVTIYMKEYFTTEKMSTEKYYDTNVLINVKMFLLRISQINVIYSLNSKG